MIKKQDVGINIIHLYIKELNNELKKSSPQEAENLFKTLYALEADFSKTLKKTLNGRKIYIKFINTISHNRGGIKMARPYFRERQEFFISTVNKAIRDRKPELMYDTPINYRFINFAMTNLDAPVPKLKKLFEKIKTLRNEIINKYLHLALNRAKTFSKPSYGDSNNFADILQLANEALIMAVDKYVIDENSSNFHIMAIGRILSHLIAYGDAPSSAAIGLHNQKKLYQIRRLIQKNPEMQSNEMAKILSIAEQDVNELIEATKYQSLDQPVNSSMEDALLGDYVPDKNESNLNPYEKTESRELLDVLYNKIEELSLIEKKILKLKGVKIANSQ